MASPSPPKPWEQSGRAAGVGSTVAAPAPTTNAASAITSSATTTSSSPTPALPERPSSLTTAVNRNASAYSPYAANRLGASPYGSGYGGAYGSPYSRMGYGGYGSGMYGGGYGSMYGGMGGYGGMYGGGYGGMPMDPNDPQSLTQSFNNSTQATFQIIEGIVGAFGGFAQMLESTYMATHSSFFAMVAVAEQFGNLRNTLGSVLGIYTILRWMRTFIAKITGRPPPADAMSLTPSAFARFEGRKTLPDGSPSSPPRPSKKPFVVFLIAAFGLPYLMGKLIRSLATSQEEAERQRLAAAGQQIGPDGQVMSAGAFDPSKLDFCRVLYDFTPEQGASVQGVDLEVKKGDLVAVLSKSDPLGQPSEWWKCRARDGRMGYLPGVYLEPARKQGAPVASIEAAKKPDMIPVVEGKPGDLSAESFQKSQFYS